MVVGVHPAMSLFCRREEFLMTPHDKAKFLYPMPDVVWTYAHQPWGSRGIIRERADVQEMSKFQKSNTDG
jgi:hypothetical protein